MGGLKNSTTKEERSGPSSLMVVEKNERKNLGRLYV